MKIISCLCNSSSDSVYSVVALSCLAGAQRTKSRSVFADAAFASRKKLRMACARCCACSAFASCSDVFF